MAAPNYGWGSPDYFPGRGPSERPPARRSPARRPDKGARKRAAKRRRGFLVLVVIPVALLLGSVYVHTVSARVGERTASLEERLGRDEARQEQLGMEEAELSRAERIRALAGENLGMVEPGGGDLFMQGNEAEDGTTDGKQPAWEEDR